MWAWQSGWGWFWMTLMMVAFWGFVACVIVTLVRQSEGPGRGPISVLFRHDLPAPITRDGVQHTWASYSETLERVILAADSVPIVEAAIRDRRGRIPFPIARCSSDLPARIRVSRSPCGPTLTTISCSPDGQRRSMRCGAPSR